MQDIIHLLPDSVANQIAAGEVVQRPASIVKELVENSVDAGATSIQVLITDGGRTCVQVIDNGKGMSETDARLAFERHATSKIQTATDLFSLTTMGFRGEALASIAAVAQVELRTRRPEDDLGCMIQISGSKVEAQEPITCPVGSNFAVRNLFFNVPARRKFLKSNQTELSNIITEFERIVLTHPDISFKLTNNNVDIYNLNASSLRQRIVNVIGRKFDADLVPVEVETSLVSITGYIGQPQSARKRGAHQFFFVNGRYMNHPYFRSAVVHAYENLIPAGEQPLFFIYLAVNPSSIDVNVHPTKTEIKFDNEQDIWQVIHAVVKESLGRYANTPMIDFDTEDRPDIPIMDTNNHTYPQQPKIASTNYNPFTYNNRDNCASVPQNWSSLYEDTNVSMEQNQQTTLWDNSDFDTQVSSGESYRPDLTVPFFQYKGQYLVMPDINGLLLIDQYKAHVKVLYEQYMDNLFQHQGASQRTLFPELIQFTPTEQIVLDNIIEDLEYIGFELTNLGNGSYSINGVPSGIDTANPVKLLHDLLAVSVDTETNVKEIVHRNIALTMAKAVAIPYGQVLSDEETRLLLGQLFDLPSPRYTPDGDVVFTNVDDSEIDKLFRIK